MRRKGKPIFGDVSVGQALLWFAAFLAPFVLIAIMDRYTTADALGETKYQLRNLQLLNSNEEQAANLPVEGWHDDSLPKLVTADGEGPTSVWYRASFDVEAATDLLWAVYLSRPTGNYAVFINNHFVGDGGSMTAPIPIHMTPLIFRFPGSMLHAGANVLHVRSVSDLRWNIFLNLQVGPDRVLTPVFRDASRLIKTVQEVIAISIFAMSFVMAILAWTRPRQATFGWYAVIMFFVAVSIAIPLMPYPPFRPGQLWRNLGNISMVAYTLCTVFFVHRFLGIRRPRLEGGVVWWSIFCIGVLIVDPIWFHSQLIWILYWFWLPTMAPVCLYETWLLVRAARGPVDFETKLLAAMAWLAVVVVGHDVVSTITAPLNATAYFSYASGSAIVVYGTILLRRYVSALHVAERARTDLELRVAEKAEELERNLVRMKDMERERALASVREHFVREMHDGIGGHLVQALLMANARIDSMELKPVLERCLMELRLIIDSVDPANDNLATALGSYRAQLSQSLRQASIKVEWAIANDPAFEHVTGPRVVGILRIVQEAVTNVLKHANATVLTIRAATINNESAQGAPSCGKGAIGIEIEDNGGGIEHACQSGRGLLNMKRHAQEANASVSVQPSPTGTRVRIELRGASVALQDESYPIETEQRDRSGLTDSRSMAPRSVVDQC